MGPGRKNLFPVESGIAGDSRKQKKNPIVGTVP